MPIDAFVFLRRRCILGWGVVGSTGKGTSASLFFIGYCVVFSVCAFGLVCSVSRFFRYGLTGLDMVMEGDQLSVIHIAICTIAIPLLGKVYVCNPFFYLMVSHT